MPTQLTRSGSSEHAKLGVSGLALTDDRRGIVGYSASSSFFGGQRGAIVCYVMLFPGNQKFIDDFFAAIAPYEAAFRHVGFSYLAVRFGSHFAMLRGRIFLNTAPLAPAPPHFESPHVRAGHYALTDLDFDVRGLINQLLTGSLKTPHGDLLFAVASGGHHGASFQPFHPDGLLNQQRFNVLTLIAGETENICQPEIDWEIKAASRPYDGLQELANEFSLGQLVQRPPYVEAVAFNVAAIDLRKSKVAGTNADIHVLTAKGLSRDRVTLGYRAYVPGSATTREVVSGATMQWTEEFQADCGHITLQIPPAAALNCTVSYAGIAQHHFWLGDPERAQNPRRAVYEAFDPKLATLSATIANAQGRGEDARDLESAVAWLLWMLGFSIAHLNTRRTRDAADLLLTTPSGHFAIVECTTGLLKAENKLSLLHERAEAARRGLAASNSAHLRLIPVMVTSKTRADITPDLETADKLGILVMTRESLESAMNRTLTHPNPDQMYEEAERSIREAAAKYQAQGSLPLSSS